MEAEASAAAAVPLSATAAAAAGEEERAAARAFFEAIRVALEGGGGGGGGGGDASESPAAAAAAAAVPPVPPNVYGRIGMFSEEEDRSSLAGAGRRCVFAFGAESAALLLRHNPWDVLIALGLQDSYLRYKLVVARKAPYLYLFHHTRTNGSQLPVHRATWAGVEAMVRALLPEVAGPVLEHLPVIAEGGAGHDLAALEAAAGYRFVEALTTRPELYMSVDRYAALPAPRAVWQTRALLYCELRVLELFDGRGFTMDASGHVGVPEYLVANTRMDAMADGVVINLAPYTVVPPQPPATSLPPAAPRPSPY